MARHNVRLLPEAEEALERIMRSTGMSISAVLNRGVLLLGTETEQRPSRTAYQVYAELDLGPGGDAVAPSTATRRGIRKAITRKRTRRR